MTPVRRPLVVATLLAACSGGGGPTTPPPPPPPPAPATVTVSPATGSVSVGATLALAATVRDAAGQAMQGQAINWSTSNPGIASVSNTGVVTGVSQGGPVTVTATSGGKSGTAAISVTVPPVATVGVTAPQSTIGLGATMQLTATPRDGGGAPLTGRTITWSSSNPAVASVSGTGLVTALTLGGPVTITATSEGKSGSVAVTVARPALRQGWTLQRQISVAAGSAAAPAGYSVMVQLDHAALVAAGKSLASGNDLRVALWTGTQWVEQDRVLDAGSSWNSAITRIWFRVQAPIAANATDAGYYLHYGNPAAAADAPANPDQVFLFHDDFESGTLSRWSQSSTTWSNVGTRAHRGTRSLRHGPEGPQGRRIVADPALDVGDVYVDAWWNVSSLNTEFNSSQMPRYRPAIGMYYTLFCLCIGGQMGFNIASYLNGTYTDVALPTGTPQPNTWMRVGTAMHNDWYRVYYNNNLALQVNNFNAMASGNVGFDKFVIPDGDELWLDDVVVRRYVFPEPAATLGSEGTSP